MADLRRGVTLVELVVTVAVVGVLAAVAFPGMSDFIDRQRLVNQMRAVADLAQFARSEAIKRSAAGQSDVKSIAMTINPGTGGSGWFVGLANGTAACSGSTCVINEGGNSVAHGATATECSGCTMAAPTAQQVVVFDLRGLATGGTSQAITLRSPLGKQLSVTISRLGRVSACSPGGSVTGYPAC